MSGTLTAVDAKIKRAERYIAECAKLTQSWINSGPYRVEVEDDPEDSGRLRWILREQRPDPVPRADFGLVLGDAVHNLRSSLDHLACGLIAEVSRSPLTRESSFPVFREPGPKTPQQVKSLVCGKVSGARQDLIDKLCALEPYEGVHHELLWALHHLDILDKHRLLVTAAGATGSVMWNLGQMARNLADTAFVDAPEEIREMITGAPNHWIEINATVVTFPLEDGTELTSAPKDIDSSEGHEYQFPFT